MQLSRVTAVPLAGFLVAATASFVFAQQSLTVNLAAQGGSGVSGTATLTDIGGGRTRVVVRVSTGGNPNMPAHIHDGRCPAVGAVVYPLQNPMNGSSTTEVNASLASLLAGTFAINLHKSPQEVPIYVSCGNVVVAAARAGGLPGEFLAGTLAVLGALVLAGGLALRRKAALRA